MNDYDKLNTLVQIAKLYYLHNLGQQAIADKLKISRSYVSKLLIEAKASGLVEIKIKDAIEAESKTEEIIREKFGLKKVIVVPVEKNELSKNLDSVGTVTARYLYNIVEDGDILSVAWGHTMHVCAQKLIKKDVKDVVVTQLYGGLTYVEKGIHAIEIVLDFARAFGSTPYIMLLPALVDNEKMKNVIIKDSSVANVLNLAIKSQIALFSVGEFGPEATIVKAGYFTLKEVDELLKKGVAGDFCVRTINIKGEIVDSELDKRTIGIPLDNLRHKKYSILVAADERKAKGIYGVLKGGYANVLIIDEFTAKALLNVKE